MKTETYDYLVNTFSLDPEALDKYPQAKIALMTLSKTLEDVIGLTPDETFLVLTGKNESLQSVDKAFPNVATKESDNELRLAGTREFFYRYDFDIGLKSLRKGITKKEVFSFYMDVDGERIEFDDPEAKYWNAWLDHLDSCLTEWSINIHEFTIAIAKDKERFLETLPESLRKSQASKAAKAKNTKSNRLKLEIAEIIKQAKQNKPNLTHDQLASLPELEPFLLADHEKPQQGKFKFDTIKNWLDKKSRPSNKEFHEIINS